MAGEQWSPDPDRPRHIHVVGIGGAGMSAIASVLATMGHRVSGSDLRSSPVTERLVAAGIPVAIGHRAENVVGAEVVTSSPAVAADNPELVEARRLGLVLLTRAEALAGVAALKRSIAVAGTHGKTTTASMLALVLVEAGMDASFVVGGDLCGVGTNAVWDGGEWLVVEADESDGSFLDLRPDIAVITNVESDHLDHYGTFDALRDAFDRFCSSAARRVVGGDDPTSAAIGRAHGADLVGLGTACTHRLVRLELARSSLSFDLVRPDGPADLHLEVPVPGAYNARHAAVAAVAALAAGAPEAAVAAALARFGGVARRFEFRGSARGVTFVDDYGHLPGEVQAVLAAARGGGWRRVVAVFQPHRFTRTAELGRQFGPAFADADVVVITDVYSAGQAPIPGVSGRMVAEAVQDSFPDKPVHYVVSRNELARFVAGLLQDGDLCLTLGAGDVTSLPDELLAELER
jgi:UDP-N-acetylmuramate--alanine ligase